MIIKAGSRKSLLALVQTQIIADLIQEKFPQAKVEIVPISTQGDERLDRSLDSFGGKGVFTRELEDQLLSGKIDIAVHSAKDMPTELTGGLTLGAVVGRGPVEDVLVTCRDRGEKMTVEELPKGFVIGTGSLRRQLQIKAMNPEVKIKPIRGNIQTRLNKLAAGEYDGIILARAGILRMEENHKIADEFDYSRFFYVPLDRTKMLPAAGQGLLAVETRQGHMESILKAITDPEAWEMLEAERAFLQAIGGGCNAPAAALSSIEEGQIHMDALYVPDGVRMLRTRVSLPYGHGRDLGVIAAEQLLNQRKKHGDRDLGHVYFIGAGPGDRGLISKKGLECLKKAQVIIYDNLASPALLNEADEDALLIYAGKRAGSHYMKQEEISRLIVRYAREGYTVARLKGGDVFVFGRGGEEGLALKEAGISFDVIPGISSAYAVPAYQGIPVTHRGLASSFHVITGHEDGTKERMALDYATLAREEGTLVFLMGLKNLPDIAARLISFGRDPSTPAAVLESGTTARQRMVAGTLENIGDIAKAQGIKTPAITVVGDVVSLHDALAWYDKKPLAGKSVLLTGTKPLADEMAGKLEELGAQAVPFSLIHTRPVKSIQVDDIYQNLREYTWAVFTSRNGVDVFFTGLKERRIDMRILAGIKFAAIGDGTAKALESYGIYCDYIPEKFTSADMAKDWVPTLTKEDRVVLLRASGASKVLPEALSDRCIPYTTAALYETVSDRRKKPELGRLLSQVDYVALCSVSAAQAFDEMTRDTDPGQAKILAIGPVTEAGARARGLHVYKTAQTYNIDGLIRCILEDNR